MKKRTWLVLLVLLLTAVGAVTVWWQRGGKKQLTEKVKDLTPSVTLLGMNIEHIDRENIRMLCRIRLGNPLPVDFKADSLQYQVFADSALVIKSTYTKPQSVKAKDTQVLDIPVEIKSSTLKRLIEQFDRKKTDSADYTVRAQFRTQVPLAGKRRFDVSLSKRLPAIRKIKAEPGKIRVRKPGLKDARIGMTVRVTNDNSFPINIVDGSYTMTVDRDLQLQGTLQPQVHIPARGTADVAMNMDIGTAKVPALGWKMLFRKKQTEWSMHFKGKLRSEMSMLDKTQLDMKMQGTLDDLVNLAKTK